MGIAGDAVYVLGLTREELGASEYYHLLGAIGNSVPQVDAAANLAMAAGCVRSAHDCSDGGLWVALETPFTCWD